MGKMSYKSNKPRNQGLTRSPQLENPIYRHRARSK